MEGSLFNRSDGSRDDEDRDAISGPGFSIGWSPKGETAPETVTILFIKIITTICVFG